MAWDILGKSFLFVDDDICNWDAGEEEQVEHKGASATNAEADAAAPIVAAAAVATNDFIFTTGLLWVECGVCTDVRQSSVSCQKPHLRVAKQPDADAVTLFIDL